MKRNKIIVIILGVVLLSCFAWALWKWHNSENGTPISLIYFIGIATTIAIVTKYLNDTSELKEKLSETTKELILKKVATANENMAGISNFLFEFMRETKEADELIGFRITAKNALIKRYLGLENLTVLASNISDDTVHSGKNSWLRNILNDTVEDLEVKKHFSKLFAAELLEAKKDNFGLRARGLLLYAEIELKVFRPFEIFTKELAELKELVKAA